jgi:hypothetical protein
LIAGFSAYLLHSTPPADESACGCIWKQSPLQMMALFVPVPFIMLCFLLIFLGILMFAAFANEKISGTFRSNAGWPGLIRQTDIN